MFGWRNKFFYRYAHEAHLLKFSSQFYFPTKNIISVVHNGAIFIPSVVHNRVIHYYIRMNDLVLNYSTRVFFLLISIFLCAGQTERIIDTTFPTKKQKNKKGE